jgi:type VI secretion system protein ImpH
LPYAELILDRRRERDFVLHDFLDLFNHRLISLFYRAWEKYRYPLVYERTRAEQVNLFERAGFSVLGLGQPGLRAKLPYDARALLARAHVFRIGGTSALGLADLVTSYFGVTAAVQQFVPGWYVVDEEQCSRLGRQACELGVSLSLGSRVQVCQSRFRICLGPLSWDDFRAFLPQGDGFRVLAEIVRLATGPEYDFDFQLRLNADDVPPLRLGIVDEQGAPWLGWSTWLYRADRGQDVDEVVINGEEF